MTDKTSTPQPAAPADTDERTPEEVLAEEDTLDPDVGIDGTGVGELP